jgi:hypothetical protein
MTRDLLGAEFDIEEREFMECKGLGQILTSFLGTRKSTLRS